MCFAAFASASPIAFDSTANPSICWLFSPSVRQGSRVSLGAEVDVWNEPELFLSRQNVYDPPELPGVNAALYATAKVCGALGVTAKLAYKTAGYLMGQPLDAGPYGYVGFSVTQ